MLSASRLNCATLETKCRQLEQTVEDMRMLEVTVRDATATISTLKAENEALKAKLDAVLAENASLATAHGEALAAIKSTFERVSAASSEPEQFQRIIVVFACISGTTGTAYGFFNCGAVPRESVS